MIVKLVVERGGKRTTLRLEPPVAVIGRARGNTVRIPSAEVSRQHCRLRMAEGLVYVEDLGSINGTYLNGERVYGRQAICPGDRLGVGPVGFVVQYELSTSAQAKLRRPAPKEEEPIADFLDGLADGSLLEPVESIEDVDLEFDVISAAEEELPPSKKPNPRSGIETDLSKSFPVENQDPLRPDFSFNQPWQMPDEGDLRDLLSQMEDA
ncbi:MAG: FHA domain-containing protein, partial [Planctomycetia bacterium]|nr:FHA domain-containing protein [Planctomycetia bacterium]